MGRLVTTGLLGGALTLAAAGCGSDRGGPALPNVTAPGPSMKDRARLKACGLPERVAPLTQGVVPDGLLATGSIVLDSDAHEARILVPGTLRAAYAALLAAAPKAGATVQAHEVETLDAEIELHGDDGDLELRLQPAPSCPDGTVVRIERR